MVNRGLIKKMMKIDQMKARLRASLMPDLLELHDESAQHVGHAGYQDGGESHFALNIRAAALDGKSRVAAHRAIYAALGDDLMAQIHALSINIVK